MKFEPNSDDPTVLINRRCYNCGAEVEIEVTESEFDHVLRTGHNLFEDRDTKAIIGRAFCSDCTPEPELEHSMFDSDYGPDGR